MYQQHNEQRRMISRVVDNFVHERKQVFHHFTSFRSFLTSPNPSLLRNSFSSHQMDASDNTRLILPWNLAAAGSSFQDRSLGQLRFKSPKSNLIQKLPSRSKCSYPSHSRKKSFSYSCPSLVVDYREELISRTFLDENRFRLVSQDRMSA